MGNLILNLELGTNSINTFVIGTTSTSVEVVYRYLDNLVTCHRLGETLRQLTEKFKVH